MRKHFAFAIAAALGLVGLSARVDASLPAKDFVKKDAVAPSMRTPRAAARQAIGSGSANPHKYARPGFLDQKHKRKKLRSNAHFARSKKCTTKRK